MPVEIGSVSEWNTALRSSTSQGRTVFVDFHAEWCGPCKAISPRFAQLATQYPQALFLRVNVDNQRAIAQNQITAMPTFIAIKAGQQIDIMKGADNSLLTRLVTTHAGSNPPVAPLNEQAEKAKSRGNEHFKRQEWNDAIREYTTAIDAQQPEAPVLFANRSIARLKAGLVDEAVQDAEKAVSLDPYYGKGFVRLGEALDKAGKLEEAVKAFESAVAKSDGLTKTEATNKLQDVRSRSS